MSDNAELTLGQRLKAARKTKKMSVDDVAAQLCMTKQRILHIESNQYVTLGNRVYVRGYLRLYAQLVDLPPDEVVDAFDALDLPKTKDKASNHSLLAAEKATKKRVWLLISTVGIVLVLVLLVALWVIERGSEVDVVPKQPADQVMAQAYQRLSQRLVAPPSPEQALPEKVGK